MGRRPKNPDGMVAGGPPTENFENLYQDQCNRVHFQPDKYLGYGNQK